MKKLKEIRRILYGIGGITFLIRFVSSVTDSYVIYEWSGYMIIAIVFAFAILSAYFYFKEKKKRKS
tara:strand:- start:467 stop:664 length:198 start_codon:yes stop_codon:yes gene_type:complete